MRDTIANSQIIERQAYIANISDIHSDTSKGHFSKITVRVRFNCDEENRGIEYRKINFAQQEIRKINRGLNKVFGEK